MKRYSRMSAVVLAFCLACTQAAQAQENYQKELGLLHISETEFGTTFTSNLAYASYYFSPIPNKSLLAEAGFLSHTGSISVYRLQYEPDNSFDHSDNAQWSFMFNSGELAAKTTLHFGYTSYDTAYLNNFIYYGSAPPYYFESKRIFVGIGKYIAENLHIGLEYQNSSGKNFPYYDRTSYGANTKLIRLFDDNSAYSLACGINFEIVNLGFTIEKATTLNIEGDYFFNSFFSLGVGTSIKNSATSNLREGTTWKINSSYFITPSIEFTINTSKRRGYDPKQIEAGLSYRF